MIDIPDDFYEKRKKGEDDKYICQLIKNDNINEFKSLWEGTNEFNEVYSFPEDVKNPIIKINEKTKCTKKTLLNPYPYQMDAMDAWIKNGIIPFQYISETI